MDLIQADAPSGVAGGECQKVTAQVDLDLGRPSSCGAMSRCQDPLP